MFSSQIKTKVTEILEEEGIKRYRDDPDFHDLINWVQETVSKIQNLLEFKTQNTSRTFSISMYFYGSFVCMLG